MFIKLTFIDVKKITDIYVNPDYIISFAGKFRGTEIDLFDDKYFVKETPEQIMNMIKENKDE